MDPFPPRTRINTMIAAIQARLEAIEEVEAVADEMEEEVRGPHDHTEHMATSITSTVGALVTYTGGTTANTVDITSLSAPAMMILVANGTGHLQGDHARAGRAHRLGDPLTQH